MEIQSDDPLVVIRFTVTDGEHSLTDALNLTQAEYVTAIGMGTLDAMKQARFRAYLDFLANPPPAPPEEVSDV